MNACKHVYFVTKTKTKKQRHCCLTAASFVSCLFLSSPGVFILSPSYQNDECSTKRPVNCNWGKIVWMFLNTIHKGYKNILHAHFHCTKGLKVQSQQYLKTSSNKLFKNIVNIQLCIYIYIYVCTHTYIYILTHTLLVLHKIFKTAKVFIQNESNVYKTSCDYSPDLIRTFYEKITVLVWQLPKCIIVHHNNIHTLKKKKRRRRKEIQKDWVWNKETPFSGFRTNSKNLRRFRVVLSGKC